MKSPPPKRKKSISAQSTDNISSNNSEKNTFDPEHPATAIITVTAVEVPELTDDELSDRLHLERKVERAFFEAGKALAELRDRRLYRSTHKTFEEYCRDRFSYTHRNVNYLIAASLVVDNIKMGTNGSQILPTSERQVRPLITLEPQQQQEVWQAAVKEAGGKVPSGRIVKDVVQRIMERTKVPNTYRVGEVCQILPKDNPDLRGKGGCWCIVTHVGEYSCTVEAWDGEYTVRVDHLKPLNYSDSECQQMQLLCDRIWRLRENCQLEAPAQAVLKCLGELRRPHLTAFEEEILSFIEQKYD